jgi:MraZ protein
VAEFQLTTAPEPPRGIYPARCDEKGRLKLPVGFQEYLKGLTEKKLFATSLDRSTASIYPMPLWREAEKRLFAAEGDYAEAAENVYFTSQELGAESEMDAQGRVLLSPELRRALGMEDQSVKILARDGVISVMTEGNFEALRGKAAANPADNVKVLRRAKVL